MAKNKGRRTNINKNCIMLDKFTLMNATYAKKTFEDKTICKVISYLGVHLNVKIDTTNTYQSKWHTDKYHCNKLGHAITPITYAHLKSNYTMLQF